MILHSEVIRQMLIYLQMIETEEDKVKFASIYDRYRDYMLTVAHRISDNEEDAEDAVHQAFLYVIENLGKIRDTTSRQTRAYLVIITEHMALNIIRKNKRYVSVEDMDQIPGIEVPLSVEHDLADAISKLPGYYREVLLLRYYEGYSPREIAKSLGLSKSNVEKILWRAKQALRKELELRGAV